MEEKNGNEKMLEALAAALSSIATLAAQNQALLSKLGNGNGNGNGGSGGGKGQKFSDRSPKPVIDTKTGIYYRTESGAGRAVCSEYGLEENNWVWYAVLAADKTRFRHATPEEQKLGVSGQVLHIPELVPQT